MLLWAGDASLCRGFVTVEMNGRLGGDRLGVSGHEVSLVGFASCPPFWEHPVLRFPQQWPSASHVRLVTQPSKSTSDSLAGRGRVRNAVPRSRYPPLKKPKKPSKPPRPPQDRQAKPTPEKQALAQTAQLAPKPAQPHQSPARQNHDRGSQQPANHKTPGPQRPGPKPPLAKRPLAKRPLAKRPGQEPLGLKLLGHKQPRQPAGRPTDLRRPLPTGQPKRAPHRCPSGPRWAV